MLGRGKQAARYQLRLAYCTEDSAGRGTPEGNYCPHPPDGNFLPARLPYRDASSLGADRPLGWPRRLAYPRCRLDSLGIHRIPVQ